MRRLLLPVLIAGVCLCRGARSQAVPGRDLLAFPLATLDRAAALPGGIGDGYGNPAAIALDQGRRFRIGLAALQTPSDQSVDLRILAGAVAHGDRDTFGFSILHASVDNLYRTTTDPQTVGTIPYNTTLTSLAAAHRFGDHLTAGVAARYRTGEIDGDRRGTVLLDFGATATTLPFADARLGVASFLWRPVNPSRERPALNAGGDLRLYASAIGTVPFDVRGGYGVTLTEGAQREDVIFGTARIDGVQVNGGLVRTTAFGASEWRSRFGIGVRFDQYSAGVAREQNGAGLDPIYQFTLSTTIR